MCARGERVSLPTLRSLSTSSTLAEMAAVSPTTSLRPVSSVSTRLPRLPSPLLTSCGARRVRREARAPLFPTPSFCCVAVAHGAIPRRCLPCAPAHLEVGSNVVHAAGDCSCQLDNIVQASIERADVAAQRSEAAADVLQ